MLPLGLRWSSIKLYVGTAHTLCILNVGTVPTLCILNVGTVTTLCILNVGTVPTFSPSELVLSQWHPHWWMGRSCRQRAQRRRCPKIVNFGRTEGCCIKKWDRIGANRSSLAIVYDVWRHCATSTNQPISGLEKFSITDKQTNSQIHEQSHV